MQKRIINPTYSYVGEGVVSYGVTFQIASESGEILFEKGVSQQVNIKAEGWAATLKNGIVEECRALAQTFGQVMAFAVEALPGITTPAEAVQALAQIIEAEVNA